MLITEQQLLQIFPNAGHRAGFFWAYTSRFPSRP